MAATVKIDFRIGDPSAVARSLRGIVAEAKKAAKEGVNAALSEERRSAREQMAIAKQATAAKIAEAKLAAKAQTDAVKAESRKQLDAERAASRERTQIIARETRDRVSAAKRAAAEAAKIDRAYGNGAYGRSTLSGMGAGARRGAGLVAGAAGVLTGGIGIATLVNAGRSQLDLGRRNALLQNSSGRDLDYTRMSKDISNATGSDAGEVMGGFEAIAGKAGGAGIDQVKDKMLDLAKIAKGAGVNMTDLGSVVATLVNRGAKADDLAGIIEGLVQQGKDGAVEFKDLATMLDASSGALGRFKMGTKERLLTAGGITQIAKTYGKKSAEEATNSVEDLARDLGGKADIIQALTGGTVKGKKRIGGHMTNILGGGVEVGTDSTRAQLRDVNTLLPEIIMGAISKGNAGKLMGEGGIFTGNSTSIVAPLIQAATLGITKNAAGRYDITGNGEKADVKGDAAIRLLMKQFSAADVKPGESKKAFEKVMATDGEKLSVAMNRLTNDMGDKLAPAIEKNIPAFVKFGEAFVKYTAMAIENPERAAIAFVGLNAAAGGVQAVLSKIGGSLLDNLFKSVGVMNVSAGTVNAGGPGGMGGGAGAANMLAGAAVAATVGVGVGIATASTIDKGLDKKRNERTSMFSEALDLSQKMGNGTATDADRARAEALKTEIKTEQDKGAMGRVWDGMTAGARGLANGDVSVGNIASLHPIIAAARGAYEGANATQEAGQDSKLLSEALASLTAAQSKPIQLAGGQTMSVVVTNAADLRQAANTQGPQAQLPP